MRAHQDDVWIATAAEIAKFYRDTYWEQSLNDIKRRGLARPGVGFDIGAKP